MESADDIANEIERMVHDIKVDRNTWKAVAEQYKAAFHSQTARLKEMQGICIAAQAELENERARSRQIERWTKYNNKHHGKTSDERSETEQVRSVAETAQSASPRGSVDKHTKVFGACNDPLFESVHQSIERHDYGTALAETERLLQGPLVPKARAEGLLLKSNILRAIGPDELYEALAACSEAIDLCNRLTELEAILPQVQRQRAIINDDLHMLAWAYKATEPGSTLEELEPPVGGYRRLQDDDLRVLKRRSGFDESRTFSEQFMAGLVLTTDVGQHTAHPTNAENSPVQTSSNK